MALDSSRFIKARPFLHHLTATSNLRRIHRLGHLESAATLLAASMMMEWTRRRREAMLPVVVDSETVLLRDQQPLNAWAIKMQDGMSYEDFVEYINRRVFFWPGNADTPMCQSGKNHFEKYRRLEQPAPTIIRVDTRRLIELNPNLEFTHCNSGGATRFVNGRALPRGKGTFMRAEEFPRTASNVIEVVFPDRVRLPKNGTFIRKITAGAWKPLFA